MRLRPLGFEPGMQAALQAALSGALTLFLAGCAATTGTTPGSTTRSTPGGTSAAGPPPVGAQDDATAAEAAVAEDAGEEDERAPITGWSSTTLRYRRTDDAEDIDLLETLSLDFGDPERDDLTGHLLLYAAADLNGRTVEKGEDADFTDLDDSYDSDLIARLYDAYVDVHSVDGLEELRLGRQNLYDTPVFALFDGVWLETEASEKRRASLGLYLGRSIHHFETAFDDDQVAGAYVQGAPWRDGRLRLDYMHLEDDTRLTKEREDLLSIRAWQTLGDRLRLSGGHTRLDGEERDVFWRAHWVEPEQDLGVQVEYYELLEPQGQLAYELDPYSSLLFELEPYRQGKLQLSKGFGEHVVVEAGASARRVIDDDDEGEFNREYDERHLTLSFADLPGEVELALTGTIYDDSGSEIETLGADVNRDFGETWNGSLGTYYALYEIDLFQQRERDHSRVWYLRAKNRARADLLLDFRLEYESDDFDDYLVTRVGAKWSF